MRIASYSRSGRRHLLFCFFVIINLNLFGQPGPYPVNTPINYVRVWSAVAPENDPTNLLGRPIEDVKLTTQYFDGLGRPLQTVLKMGSLETSTNTWADLVSTNTYDEFGRETHKYLPSPANSTGGNTSIIDGLFKYHPFDQQFNFMVSQYGSQNESDFYGQTNYEASPLNRVEKTLAPGNSWVRSDRGVAIKNWFNTSIDAVRIWTVTDGNSPGVFGTYSSVGTYPAGELYKTVTIDENGMQVIEFKDKEGKVILKKVQVSINVFDDGTGKNHDNWLCTYYIYDDLNNLRCVIQPRGIELISGTWQLSDATILAEQCFRYEYDARKRLIVKKVPGASQTWMVYDNRDRLVLTQDGNLNVSHKWMYTTYDELNRTVTTGLWTINADWASLQAEAFYSIAYPNLTGATFEELTRTFYDNYNWGSLYGNPLDPHYDNSFDNYLLGGSNNIWPYAKRNVQSNQITGMVTGTRIKILGASDNYLFTVNFYNDKEQVIQVKSQNITNGIDIITSQYTWSGQPLIIVQKQENKQSVGQNNLVITNITYDELGRVVKTEKKLSSSLVNGGTMPDNYTTISENKYDKLGQLVTKKLDPAYNSDAGLETLNYDYNIRGWLLGINRNYVKEVGLDPSNHFGFELAYDNTNNIVPGTIYAAPQYNGNITGTTWKSAGDQEKRIYDFTYDPANRLKGADFKQYTGGSFNLNANVNFSVTGLNYDANGNIIHMNQNGLKLNSSDLIDNLSYTYESNSNKLSKVTDAIPFDPTSKLGDFNDGTNASNYDYTYDPNGNLKEDRNKNIKAITYNHLNLPSQISFNVPNANYLNYINYTYDATGNKLRKEVIEKLNATDSRTTTTTYLNGSVYESKISNIGGNPLPDDHNDLLLFIPQEEGRIRFKPTVGNTPASFQYDYMLKDHLGNVRMVLTDEIQQDIYPAATLEGDITADGAPNAIHTEKDYYTINPDNVKSKSDASGIPDYPNNNDGVLNNNPLSATADLSDKLYMLQATNGVGVTGLGITLKVMSGDRIDILGKSYYLDYNVDNTSSNNFQVPILDILTGFLGGTTNAAGITNAHGSVDPSQLAGGPTLSGLGQILFDDHHDDNETNGTQTRPRAYINYMIFDEQFKLVPGGYNSSQVGGSGELKDHFTDLQNIQIPKNGFIYIYCSNESPVQVFFDNLQVVHTRGPILEETHYYPFGLTMAGISSKAAGGLENKIKYNSKELQSQEFSNGGGLELYDYGARMQDPQIGRFWQVDALADIARRWSPYVYAADNPIRFIDPDGNLFDDVNDKKAKEIQKGIAKKKEENNSSIANLNSDNSVRQSKIDGLKEKLKGGGLSGKEIRRTNNEISGEENGIASNNGKIAELDDQNNFLTMADNNVEALRSDQEHNYSFVSPEGDQSEHHVKMGKSPSDVLIEGSNNSYYIHEMGHIAQSLNAGALLFSNSGDTKGLLVNSGFTLDARLANEQQTYQLQFSYNGSFITPIKRLSEITVDILRAQKRGDGNPLYE